MSKDKKMNRRDFLKAVGLTVGATALSCSGLGAPSLDIPPVGFWRGIMNLTLQQWWECIFNKHSHKRRHSYV